MKTLIVCDSKGECVLTLTDVNDKYNCSITDVAEYQIAIGKDLETNKIIKVSKDTSDYKKQKLIEELIKKNEAYSNKVELEQVKAENKERNEEIKENIKRLENANKEILEFVSSTLE